MDSEDLTVEEYLSMMHNSEDETLANSMDHQDKTVEDYLKENGLAPYEEIATENVEHADMTVEEYLQQIKDETTENEDQGGVLDEGLTQNADGETVDVSVEDYLKEMEAARDISVEDYLKQMESERNQTVDHASEGKSDERDQHQSPASSPEHGKHKRRVLRISRTKREELKHEHEEGKAGKDHKADKSSKDETTAKGLHEKKQTSPRSKRRISHHKDDGDKKAETHHRGQEHGMKPSISEEKPKVSAVKPRPDTGSAAARARRRSAGKQHDAGTAHAGHEAHASTKAADAHPATGRDARAAASSKKHDDHVTRKTSHDVGEARKSHTSMAARKASLPSKIAERPQKETTDRKTSSDVHKTHRVATDRKASHGSSVAHTEKVAAFASKGRSSTVAGVPVEERRKQMKERASSLSHEPPVSKPRSSSSREVTAKPSHETHGRKSATLPRSRVVKQESGEKEDEPKLTPSQIRARFEKKHDGHKSHGTAARAPKSGQTVTARHKGDKHATAQIDEHPEAEHHKPEHHKPEHQKTEHHKPEHHKPEHQKTEHHKPEHHKTEHHKPEHHKPVHHKPVHHKTEHHQETTDPSQAKDGDTPLTTANIRSRFEAASKTGSPPKRKFTPSSKQPRPVSGAGPKKFGQVQSNKCDVCSKTVYPMEKLEADGHIYHKFCLKCAECKCTLRLGNYAALSGKIYCKPHLKQLFRLKGNYDEGFGREQHKKNWVGKDSKPVSSSNPAAADAEETGEPEAEPEPAIPVVNGEHNEVTAEA